MRTLSLPIALRAARRARLAAKFSTDTRGTTAIEFGMVFLPFLMLAFGIMGMGFHFFTQNALDHAVEAASRQIRTGEAQQTGVTASQFKQMVCDEAGTFVDCSKLELFVQTGTDWSGINPAACVDSSGVKTTPGGGANDPIEQTSGGAGQVVLVTACYEWELAQQLFYLHLSNMANSSSMIQSATTFRTEPYQ